MLITCSLLIASGATVPFMSFFFDVPESPDRCRLMGPPRKLPASVPSAPLLAVRDGEVGHDEVEEAEALAAFRLGLPWKGPCPVLDHIAQAEAERPPRARGTWSGAGRRG